jgi:hypothetical protein
VDDLTDLQVGTAAEHLVCADLILSGYAAFLTDQNFAYDIVIDQKNRRFIRVQVKATRQCRRVAGRNSNAYCWHVKRAGKGGRRYYSDAEFDLLALVALDIKRIVYFIPQNTSNIVQVRAPNTTVGKQFDDYTLEKAINEILLLQR